MSCWRVCATWAGLLFALPGGVLGQTAPMLLGGLGARDAVTSAVPFTSLELSRSSRDFQFAIVADRTGRTRPGVFDSAMRKLNLLQPQFVMCVGDLVQGYTRKPQDAVRMWDQVLKQVHLLTMPFFFVPGNHDLSTPVMRTEWAKHFGRSYYAFRYEDVLFLCLSTEEPRGRLGAEQIGYFRQVLRESPSVRWTFVFMHEPLWSRPEKATKKTPGLAENGWKEFEPLLAGRNYTVFAGHVHRYSKSVRNKQHYIVLATTGGAASAEKLGKSGSGIFDHVMWVSMTDKGPVLANLMLDGIYDEDVPASKKDTHGAGSAPAVPQAKPELAARAAFAGSAAGGS